MISLENLPRHIAVIMDGNGRWAQAHGRPRTDGHRHGAEAVRRTVRACRRLGVSALTLYAFSEQNWERPEEEIDCLMHLLAEFIESEREEIIARGIRITTIGRTNRLPGEIQTLLAAIANETRDLDGMDLVIALSYGGREEIADTARELAERVKAGTLDASSIDETLIDHHLPSMRVGVVDLLIRTSGEQRLSNFLPWGSAYAELVFVERLWPEFDEADLYRAIAAYQHRERRFGRVLSTDAPAVQAPSPLHAPAPAPTQSAFLAGRSTADRIAAASR